MNGKRPGNSYPAVFRLSCWHRPSGLALKLFAVWGDWPLPDVFCVECGKFRSVSKEIIGEDGPPKLFP